MLLPRSLRGGLASHDRRALRNFPEKHAFLRAGGGHAVIYGPDGSSLAEKLPPDQEGILYADIDLGMIGVAKNAADPAGHYSRPDVTRLLLNASHADHVRAFRAP